MEDPPREIPSDEEFGKRVTEARDAKGWKQGYLAARVGCSQPVISAIEAGGSSKFIPAVCRVLKIPGPMYGWPEQQKKWAIVGHKLEAQSEASFKMAMGIIQQMLDELERKGVRPDDDRGPPPPPPKKKLRAVGRANIGGIEQPREVRSSDDLLPRQKK